MVRGWSRVISVVLGVAAMAMSSTASAWWNDDWAFRKELALDLSANGANIAENAQDVPVLLRLSIANFPYFADAKPDGSDLRVIAGDDKTPLKFHVEKFDAQAQIALVWVHMPQITGGMNADKIFLYYGSKKGQAAGDSAGTYDASQSLVYHFAASAGGHDSASYKNEAQGLTAAANTGSIIGEGLRFDGSNYSLTRLSDNTAAIGSPFTAGALSAWVRPDGSQNSTLVALRDQGHELAIGINGDKAFARWRAGADTLASQTAGTLVGEWHLVALRAEGGKLALLVDGVEVAQASIKLQDFNGGLTVGGQTGAFYRGDLDELQVSNVARSVAWLRAAAQSQGMVAPLVVYGGDSQKEGAKNDGYFAATMHSVTFDGWVVIAILSVMFLSSIAIMIGKLQFLARVARGNNKFLAEFHRMRDDPAMLERKAGGGESGAEDMAALDTQNDTYGISTLWRLYHHGMQETMKRVDGQASGAGQRKLSHQSIEAIRATLDATQTRMGQRLQSQMVWLTISIAGGPFLGLLGTVIGVMITFAAIAASGEVNVNAIAPGTAAALVATVAGLGVAIPCLFGYNYLNTRIKQIMADMRVFVDEFVTRIAETYS